MKEPALLGSRITENSYYEFIEYITLRTLITELLAITDTLRLYIHQVYRMTHSQTGEVMVLKELYRVDEQAQKNFLKEVRFNNKK